MRVILITYIIGVISGAIGMFWAVRNNYVRTHKKNRIPSDLELGNKI